MRFPRFAAMRLAGRAMPLALLVTTLLTGPAAVAENGEGYFEQASAYTVQIRTVVQMAFSEDERSSSMGAGFVVDAERGWVMTNAHVVARSPSQIRVRLHGGDYHVAEKLYVDPYLDLAIVQLGPDQRENLVAATPDCGELPPVGHPVGAFGHPWGLTNTGTRGIVSGVTSRFGGEMLQIDAPINAGNSGGPLLSLETGRIVGISTAGIDEDDDQNTNFAEPMKYACRVLALLRDGRDPSPPQLGTIFFDELDEEGRLVVAQTYLGAGTLAIEPGDVIVGVDGEPGDIHNEGQLVHSVRGHLDDVGLILMRGGERKVVEGRLPPAASVIERRGVYVSGLVLAPSGLRDSRELNLEQPIMVHSVDWGSFGESLEIDKWDILARVDGKPVTGLDDLFERLHDARESGAPVMMAFKRWSGRHDRVYDYIERELVVEDLELIGPSPKELLAQGSSDGRQRLDVAGTTPELSEEGPR